MKDVILSRYLTKEVLESLLAVTFILLLIFLSNQLVRYLSYAASGKMAPNILLQLLGFEIPYLLALLLPLGLYLGIILSYGRLYAENEMSVMQACGLSQSQLTGITSTLALFICLFIFILTCWINPLIADNKERVLSDAMSVENVLANLMPGRFQVTSDGKRVIYVENISRNHKVANNLFFADQVKPSLEEHSPSVWSVVSATRGYQEKESLTHRNFLVAESGYRYEGSPGQNDYKIIQFKKYAVLIPEVQIGAIHRHTEGIPTATLWDKYTDSYNAAELQWRISIPLSAFLLALLAIQLSYVEPREGRYATLLPAILIYVLYVNLLFIARNWIEQKTIPIYLGMWWVHGVLIFICISILIFRSSIFRQWIKRS